jgi:hypothetical protein
MLSVKSGYTFMGVAANSFTYTGATVTNAANSGAVTITFPETAGADAAVSAFDLTTLLSVPAATATPPAAITPTEQYTGTIVWYTGGTPFTGETFAAFTVYRAMVTLSAKSGYTFTGVQGNNFIHMGADTVTNTANSGTVIITFPATGPSGSADITVGFAYGDITITGNNGSNVISKSGANSRPTSLALSASDEYTNVVWYIDGNATGIADSGSGVTIAAAAYYTGSHSVTFTGKRGSVPYSRVIPFTVQN